MAHLCGLGLGDMALDGGEYGLDRPLRIDRPASAFETVRDAGDELRARTHRGRLNGGTILLAKRSTNQQGQLGSQVRCVVDGKPIAQGPKDDAEDTPRQLAVRRSNFLRRTDLP